MSLQIEEKQQSGPRVLTNILLVVLGLFVLYFVRLGAYPLIDPDEPVYGQVAKEMAAGTGWLTPHYDGEVWFDKPPLFYWLSAASVKLIGATEFACRFPSAILAVALVLLVYALASHDLGRRGGILSAVVMATCVQQIVLARAAVTDMTFAVCLTGALYAYRRWLDADAPARLLWVALCGAMTGLAALAKGPVAPVLLSATFVIHLWWTARLKRLLSADALMGVLAFVIVGLPWYAAMYSLHREQFVRDFVEKNNIARFTTAEHAEQTGKWYSYLINLPILLVFFFPWSVFLPAALVRGRRGGDGVKLSVVWLGVVFVFFSLSKTILVTYIFPAYAAAAVLVGALLSSQEPGLARTARRCVWVGLAIAVLLAVGITLTAGRKFPGTEAQALMLMLLPALAIAAALVRLFNRGSADVSATVWYLGGGMAAFTLWLMFAVLPLATPWLSTRELVRDVPRDARVKLVSIVDEYPKDRHPSLLFYLGRSPRRMKSVEEARALVSEDEPVFLICRQTGVRGLATAGSVEIARSGDLAVIANKAAASLKGPVSK